MNPEAAFGSVFIFITENILAIRAKRDSLREWQTKRATPDRESLQSLTARLKPRP
jgi:hypothetical protein